MGIFGVKSKNAMDKVSKSESDSKYLMDCYINEADKDNVTMMFQVPDMGIGQSKNALPDDIAKAIGKSNEYVNRDGYTKLSFQKTGFMRGKVMEPAPAVKDAKNFARVRLTGKEIKAAFMYMNDKRSHAYTDRYNSATFALHTLRAAGLSLPTQLHYVNKQVSDEGAEQTEATKALTEKEARNEFEQSKDTRLAELDRQIQMLADRLAAVEDNIPLAKSGKLTPQEVLNLRTERDKICNELNIQWSAAKKGGLICKEANRIKRLYEKACQANIAVTNDRADLREALNQHKSLSQHKFLGYSTVSAGKHSRVFQQLDYMADTSERQNWTLHTRTNQGMTTSYWNGTKVSNVDEYEVFNLGLTKSFGREDKKIK